MQLFCIIIHNMQVGIKSCIKIINMQKNTTATCNQARGLPDSDEGRISSLRAGYRCGMMSEN